MRTPLDRFRSIALLEGASFVLLLGIAMPLKYLAGMPMAVKVVGWAHGLLFVLYVAALFDVASAAKWPLTRVAWAFLASLVPFGTFVLEAQLRKETAAAPSP
jgi:integral membrane protein